MEGEKILIIDSDTRIVELAVIKLSNAGYWVMTAADGDEGHRKLFNSPPDLLLINPVLPQRNGYEIIGEVQNNPVFRKMALILLADRKFDEEQFRALGLKVDDILAKPFTPKTLLGRVNSQIVKSRLVRELNPLTVLPGKIHLEETLKNRVSEGGRFDLVFIDLKGFTMYNKFYGFEQGNRVIQFLANLLLAEAGSCRSAGPELYHLGGDDFCVLLNSGSAEDFCQKLMSRFDREIGGFYLEEDRSRGGLVVTNRRGFVEQWPMMTMTMGIVSNEQRVVNDWLEAELIGKELLNYAKSLPGSKFVRDRRRS
jgi:DNA-binding response OmpR family regulator